MPSLGHGRPRTRTGPGGRTTLMVRRAGLACVAVVAAGLLVGAAAPASWVASAGHGVAGLTALAGALTLLVRRRALYGALLIDGGVIGTALGICLVADPPLAMLGRGASAEASGTGIGSAMVVPTGVDRLGQLLGVALVVAAVYVLASSDWRSRSARLLGGAAAAAAAAQALTGLPTASTSSVPTVGSVLLAVTALALAARAFNRPDSAALLRVVDHDAAAWSPARLGTVIASFGIPLYCLTSRGLPGLLIAVPLAGLTAMVALVLARAVVAVRAMAAATAELAHRANHDELTGLPNRAALLARLATAQAEGERLAVYFVDLNGFKLVNDSLGHEAGDQMLRAVGSMLTAQLPAHMMVARLGGDEFVVVEPDPVDCPSTAARLGQIVATPVQIGGLEMSASASVGMTRCGPDRLASPQDLLREADTAMYKAKGRGLGVAVFERAQHEQALADLTLGQSFRRAVDAGSLHAVFEPMIAADSRAVVAAEALMRWVSPDLGAVAPSRFIPVAEDQDYIAAAFDSLLDQGLRQILHWRADSTGRAASVVSVNVSPAQLTGPAFTDTIAAALARHGLTGESLWLELTESRPLADLAVAAAVMRSVADLGVRWALDDFGTGCASTELLLDLPVSIVKIDQRFTAAQSSTAAQMVGRMTELAHALGHVVVAEGCSTPAQLAMLVELGVDLAQGYWVTRAVAEQGTTPSQVRV